MTSILLVIAVVCGLIGRVTPDRLSPGETHQFDYGGDRYWVFIDWCGTVNYQKAVDQCKTLHAAKVTNIVNDAQYDEIQTQVEGAIPGTWNKVMLWTSDSEAPNTNVMLVIWRPGTGGPNKKENKSPSYQGHGYICRKPNPDKTYHFEYDHDDYWFNINWWGTYNFATAESKCGKHGAKVVKIFDKEQLAEIESQVEKKISLDWNEVMLWTADSEEAGTNVMLVIWRPGSGGPNRKENHAPSYKGHGYVCQKKANKPGTTYSFTYGNDEYWFNIDWWGTYDLPTSETKCGKHGAKAVTIMNDEQRKQIEKEVEYRIPLTWNEVMLWTADSTEAGKNSMLVIWRPGTGGPNRIEEQPPSYKGHGYVCIKKKNEPGTTYHFKYDHDEYWFNIDWWGNYDLPTSQSKCAEHDAKVVKIIDDAQLKEIERQVEYRIPTTWNEVMLWTADSAQSGTNVMLVIWRHGTGGPTSKVNKSPSYKGHGYVCQKKTNKPGTTYSYEFDGHKYYLFIDFWGTSNYATAKSACQGLGASVASAADSAVYAEMQKQIEYRIPLTWHEVMLWTSESKSSGTHVMVIVWREGTGGPNKKESYSDSYSGHGYVCVAP